MKKIGIGLIGLGRHGIRYLHHLQSDVPYARLAAVCQRTSSEGVRIGRESGVPYYRHYQDLISDPAVDAVVVVTPPAFNREICLEAIQAKKPVLIEKPLAPTGRATRDMVAAADSSGVPLMTAHTMRFDSTIRTLKDRIAEVGRGRYITIAVRMEPRTGHAQRENDYGGRGVLLEVGIHFLDLVRFLTGEEVVEVRCGMSSSCSGGTETRSFTAMKTEGGIDCHLEVSREAVGRVGRLEWIGEGGQLVGDWVQQTVAKLSPDNRWVISPVKGLPTVSETLNAFITGVRNQQPMVITGLDGLRAVDILDACYESASKGGVATRVPF